MLLSFRRGSAHSRLLKEQSVAVAGARPQEKRC